MHNARIQAFLPQKDVKRKKTWTFSRILLTFASQISNLPF
jgi:hypothetical protein